MKLVGNVCIRNAFRLDYCIKECIESLLPVCDTISVSDGESTDGTQEFLREWMAREPKIVLNVYPWPNPVGDSDFWVKWMNYNREHIPAGSFQFQLDGDEVLSEQSYPVIEKLKTKDARFSVRMRRHNFWRDSHWTIPPGVCLAHEVIRMGPQNVWIPSDGPHPNGAEWVNMQINRPIEIFHYGFLRRRDAWFQKAKELQRFFFNNYDPRLDEADKAGGNWMENPVVSEWINSLVEFKGTHPEAAKNWLRERGYDAG